MKHAVLLAAVGSLAIAGSTFANETRAYTGQGGLIPGGTGGIQTRFEIFVPDGGEIKDVKEVLLVGLNQTWAGDLLIVLTHKDTGTSVTLLDRPGQPESLFGNSDDFAGDYSFQDGFPIIPEGTGAGGATVIAPGTYGPAGAGGAPQSLQAFVGEDKFGVWTLSITDFDAADNGSLGGWVLVLNNVPAPGALALLGVAGLAARRRRRSA